jgi:hypothetical protein
VIIRPLFLIRLVCLGTLQLYMQEGQARFLRTLSQRRPVCFLPPKAQVHKPSYLAPKLLILLKEGLQSRTANQAPKVCAAVVSGTKKVAGKGLSGVIPFIFA